MRKAVSGGVAAKGDVNEVGIGELKAGIGAVRAELRTLTWLTGLTLVVVLAMAARVFGIVQASPRRSRETLAPTPWNENRRQRFQLWRWTHLPGSAGVYVLARFAHVPARRRRSRGRARPIRRIAPGQNENC